MRYVTAGEAHGPALTAVVEGVPAGLRIAAESIDADLARRNNGYGRAEKDAGVPDKVEILSGVRYGATLGTPVTFRIDNPGWRTWRGTMSIEGNRAPDDVRVVVPCPGHADLVGVLKNNFDDCLNVAERATSRETAARVAASSIAREFLAQMGVEIFSYVKSIGSVSMRDDSVENAILHTPLDVEVSEVRCPCIRTTRMMVKEIDQALATGDTLGGSFRVVVRGLLPGVGGYATGTDRLTSQIGAALFSMPGIMGVEFGAGFDAAAQNGSEVYDDIVHERQGFTRSSNNAGGLEGGMTSGMPLVISAAVRPPYPSQQSIASLNMGTFDKEEATLMHGDTCYVPSAAVIAEGEVAFVLADAYMKKFGCDNMMDIKAAVRAYTQRLKTMQR